MYSKIVQGSGLADKEIDMQSPELSVLVGELLGVPKLTLSGSLSVGQEQAILGILNGLCENGTSRVVLDVANLCTDGADAPSTMISLLRRVKPETCVHLVASSAFSAVLSKAKLGPAIRLYSSSDEIAECFIPKQEYLTSRWMECGSEGSELPLAA